MRARLLAVDRLRNSVNGNPRFTIHYTEDGKFAQVRNTAADYSFAYEIGNRGLRVGDMVEITIGRRGTITGMVAAR